MDNYERLRQLLNKHPIGAPESPAFDQILRLLFTPEEVEVALGMGFAPRSAKKIASEAGTAPGKTRQHCESMADKGIVFSREKDGEMGYALLPTVPGLFEFPFMTGGGTPTHDELAKLWQDYHRQALGNEFAGSSTTLTRVIPIEETIVTQIDVMPFEMLSGMLDKVKTIALAQCPCRVSVGACDKPLDVCLIFDKTAEFLIQRKIAKRVTRAEAEDALRRAEEAGLIHTVNNSQDRLTLICNCCACCCTILRGHTQLGSSNAFAKSRWIAQVDSELCNGCGICEEERCQIGAVKVPNHFARVDELHCIGCGLCATACPDGAIHMVPRSPEIPEPPASVAEMGLKIAMEKDRLEDFLRMMDR